MYYHVRIDYYDSKLNEGQSLLEYDCVSKESVVDDVLKPYLTNQSFFFKGVRLTADDIRKVGVYTSDRKIEVCTQIVQNSLSRNVIMVIRNQDLLPYKGLVTDITDEILKEVNNSLSLVDGTTNATTAKKPLVFISHKHDDLDFVKELTDMLQDIGLNKSNLFCSSIPELWIGLSKDIFESLRTLFVDRESYVIFVQSPRYYQSPVSLNEMGAAWVLQTEYCSILTKDMTYDQMKGVFDNHKTAIKVDSEEASARLDEMKDSIVQFLGLNPVDDKSWTRSRDRFLRIVNR